VYIGAFSLFPGPIYGRKELLDDEDRPLREVLSNRKLNIEQAQVERNVGRDDIAQIERRCKPEAGWHRRTSWFQRLSF